MSEALQALYEGDVERAQQLLPPAGELTVFEAAAFGRGDRLRELVAADPFCVAALSEDGFTALHLAIFGGHEEAARVLLESAPTRTRARPVRSRVCRRSAPPPSFARCRSHACCSTRAPT
jgi:uncharacterized protein